MNLQRKYEPSSLSACSITLPSYTLEVNGSEVLAIGVDPSWEQFRAKHKDMHINAQNRYKNRHSCEPGQILTCRGSVHDAFYRYLVSKGVKLDESELQAVKKSMPRRYCIVNRRIHNQVYEVFLMTTFSGARNVDQIGGIPRFFGMPIGNTKWFNNIPGLIVIPPLLGVNKSSFVFAIPTVVPVVEPSAYLPDAIRVPPGELNRLRKFSQEKLEMLHANQGALRKELKFIRDKAAYADIQNDFKPMPRRLPVSMEDYDDMQRFIPNSAIVSSRFKPKRFTLPENNDISWPLRHASRDINLSKSLQLFLQRPIRDQSFLLPKPYYPPRLPISLKKVWRTVR